MLEFFNTFGLPGVLALLGSWLIVGAIIGKLLAITHILKQEVLIQRGYQRLLLGIFGGVLLGPGLHLLYEGPSAARFVTPTPTDYVAPGSAVNHTDIRPSSLRLPVRDSMQVRIFSESARLVLAGARIAPAQSQRPCRTVESFGLYAHSIRRLKYQQFRGQVFAYVGDINGPKYAPTNISLFSSDASAPRDGEIDDPTFRRLWTSASPLQLQKSLYPTQSFTFVYAGSQYKLTIAQIYKVLIGTDQTVVDICEL
jgi:hypothetical protein